jgi:hypothetical protein
MFNSVKLSWSDGVLRRLSDASLARTSDLKLTGRIIRCDIGDVDVL